MLPCMLLIVAYSVAIHACYLDSSGTCWPLIGGAAVVCAGMLVSGLAHNLAALFATAILTGTGFMFFNVSIQTLTGGLGGQQQRARNFAILSIGYSISTFIGPVSVGLAIDHLGHARAFLMLALFTLPPIIGLLWRQ
jgi:MFS family permease